MVRTYKKKESGGRVNFSSSQAMNDAYNAVMKGRMSANRASIHFGVNKTSLLRRTKGEIPVDAHVGRQTALSPTIETELVECIKQISESGWGFSSEVVNDVIQDYVRTMKLDTYFKNGRPGRDWIDRFLSRHPDITPSCHHETASSVSLPPAIGVPIQRSSAEIDEKMTEESLPVAESPEVSDDDAPEEVGFDASKDKVLDELKQIKGTIKEIKANAKLKRKNQQERNQKQKAEKLKDLDKLPDSVLQNLPSDDDEVEETSDLLVEKPESKKSKRKKVKDGNKSPLGIEDDLSFIPLKQNKKTKSHIKVVSLEKTNPNQSIPVVNFRDKMLYGANIKRCPAAALYTNLKKRKLR